MLVPFPFLAELIGTFIFVSVILNVTQIDNGVATALCIGLTLSVVVWFAMNASLGAMNPAVTLSLFLRGDLDGYTASSYVVAQFIAGFAAYVWWKHTSPAPIAKPDVGMWSVFDKRPFNGGGAPTQPVRTN